MHKHGRRPHRAIGLIFATGALVLAACPRGGGMPTPSPSPTPRPTVTDPADAMQPLAAGTEVRLVDDAGEWDSLRQAIKRSIAYYRVQPATETFVFGPREVTAAELRASLETFLALLGDDPTPEELAGRISEHFELYESVGDEWGETLVTGYFEPVIEASLKRRKGYDVPIYRKPSDMIYVELGDFDEALQGEHIAGRISGKKLVPYWTRKEIWSDRALSRRGLEIAWAKDPVDVFFLEVQGSGTLKLPSGKERRIGYDGTNGHRYESIGRLLIDEGKIPEEQMSMQAIRDYLQANPQDVARVLHHNASFVFFRFLPGEPVGNLGQPVTPERSIALDHRLLPKGALAFLMTERPQIAEDGTVSSDGPMARFVLSQDTGGAIRGPGRVDFFWGRGPEAAARAGAMNHPGRLVFLVPRRKKTSDSSAL